MKENPTVISEDYRNVLAIKGLLFNDQRSVNEQVMNSNDMELIALYNQWHSQRAYLSTLYEKTIKQRQQMGVNLQNEEDVANELEKQLSSRTKLFSDGTNQTRYNWQDVQLQLKNKEAAIELVRFNYYEKNGRILFFTLP